MARGRHDALGTVAYKFMVPIVESGRTDQKIQCECFAGNGDEHTGISVTLLLRADGREASSSGRNTSVFAQRGVASGTTGVRSVQRMVFSKAGS